MKKSALQTILYGISKALYLFNANYKPGYVTLIPAGNVSDSLCPPFNPSPEPSISQLQLRPQAPWACGIIANGPGGFGYYI